jgi:hypothetical protein
MMKTLKDIRGMVRDALKGAEDEAPDADPGLVSIGITTFGTRFERYFVRRRVPSTDS